jgi:capsular exopolysaccharide synthesis family protein
MFALELLDNGYRSSEQIERDFGLTGFGLIPRVRTGLKRSSPQDLVLDKPASAYAEAVRTLYTSLLIAQQKARAGNAFVFTSASLGEGKTSVVASLGRVAAKSGQRVMVIDCDLRRPQIHAALGLPNDSGLATYLKDGAPLEEVVKVDERSGAHVITSGPAVDDPQVLFRLPAMERLLSYLRSQYDVVLIDVPPVLPVSDPRLLATLTDLTVFVIQWKRTARTSVKNAIHKLQQAGATIAGAVLTQVEIKTHAMYGYGDSGYYHGRMKEYYKKRA